MFCKPTEEHARPQLLEQVWACHCLPETCEEKKLDAPPMQKLLAAVSAGILDGQAVLDLNYEEDKLVTVDFNLVATEDGEFVEVQGSGEEATFSGSQFDEMLGLARKGIASLIGAQRAVLARIMVSRPE
jgi:ribonuclease PH